MYKRNLLQVLQLLEVKEEAVQADGGSATAVIPRLSRSIGPVVRYAYHQDCCAKRMTVASLPGTGGEWPAVSD